MAEIYEENDNLLLQKISEGDVASFNILYEKYWEKVYTSALKRLKQRDQAKDVTQEVFTSIWLRRETLHIDNLPSYLQIAVRNRVLNLFEKEKRYVPFEQLLHGRRCQQNEQADAVALGNEFLSAYKALVDSMPEQRKKIFHYYFDEGFSTDEIANQLALSRKTVQNQIGRAVTFLKANLSQLFTLFLLLWV